MAEAVLSREPPPPPQAPYVEPPKSAYPNIHPLALAASTPTAQILPAPVGGLHSTLPLHGTAQFLLPPDGAFAQPLHSTLNFAPPSGYGQTQVFGPTPGAPYGQTPGLGPMPAPSRTPLVGPAADPVFRIVPGTPAFAPQYGPGMQVQMY